MSKSKKYTVEQRLKTLEKTVSIIYNNVKRIDGNLNLIINDIYNKDEEE